MSFGNAKFEKALEKWAKRLDRELAKRVKAIANKAKEILKRELNIKYPPASLRGEFPRRRSGALHSSVIVYPNNIPAIINNDFVADLMYDQQGHHGYILVNKFDRKGPEDVLEMQELRDYASSLMKEDIYL